jgi:gas vesicle protein
MADNSGSGYLTGLLAGLVIGGVAALLLAPRRGEDMRHELADGAAKLRGKAGEFGGLASETAHHLKTKGEDAIAGMRTAGTDAWSGISENVAELADDVKDQFNHAHDAIGEAAHDLRDKARDLAER